MLMIVDELVVEMDRPLWLRFSGFCVAKRTELNGTVFVKDYTTCLCCTL